MLLQLVAKCVATLKLSIVMLCSSITQPISVIVVRLWRLCKLHLFILLVVRKLAHTSPNTEESIFVKYCGSSLDTDSGSALDTDSGSECLDLESQVNCKAKTTFRQNTEAAEINIDSS